MYGNKKPYDQRAGVRPIAFVLRNGTGIAASVTLNIRPEDLTVTAPQRATVNQTFGRTTQGWVDDFGAGLPALNISGNTGWHTSWVSGMDGAEHWLSLRKILREDYPNERQKAIDSGLDPDIVQLLYVDMLNQYTYAVVPMECTLKRNKQKPLLFSYMISLITTNTDVEKIYKFTPWSGNTLSGLTALKNALDKLREISNDVKGWLASAEQFVNDLISPITETVGVLVEMSNELFDIVYSTINAGMSIVTNATNQVIAIGAGIAQVGMNIGRTLAAIENIPNDLMANFNRLSSAYTEIACILANALKPKKIYDNYTGAYGASNCSSTSGGSPASLYNGVNIFEYMRPSNIPIKLNTGAYSAINNLSRMDPVLEDIDINYVSEQSRAINDGLTMREAA